MSPQSAGSVTLQMPALPSEGSGVELDEGSVLDSQIVLLIRSVQASKIQAKTCEASQDMLGRNTQDCVDLQMVGQCSLGGFDLMPGARRRF